MTFFTEIEKSILKFIWKHKRLWKPKQFWAKKSNADSITIPSFKLHYRNITIKTTWYQHKKQTWMPMEQNRKPRHKFTQLQPTDYWQRSPKHMVEKR
jgi:hypothetical protein